MGTTTVSDVEATQLARITAERDLLVEALHKIAYRPFAGSEVQLSHYREQVARETLALMGEDQ